MVVGSALRHHRYGPLPPPRADRNDLANVHSWPQWGSGYPGTPEPLEKCMLGCQVRTKVGKVMAQKRIQVGGAEGDFDMLMERRHLQKKNS